MWYWGVDEGCELVDGGADGVDVVAEEREAVGCFAEVCVALVALCVGYELREVGRLVEGVLLVCWEMEGHFALFEDEAFDAEVASDAPECDGEDEFLCGLRDGRHL